MDSKLSDHDSIATTLCYAAIDERRQILSDYLLAEVQPFCETDAELTLNCQLSDMGINSLDAMDLVGRVEKNLKVRLSVTAFSDSATLKTLIEQVLDALSAKNDAPSSSSKSGTELQKSTTAIPLSGWTLQYPIFCVGGLAGTVTYLSDLANALGSSQPLIAFQPPGIGDEGSPLGSVEELACWYIEEMKAIQPVGPYVLAGHSFGGLVAYEMARRLVECGEQIAHVFLIDSSAVERSEPVDVPEDVMAMFELSHTMLRLAGKPLGVTAYAHLESMDVEHQRLVLANALGVNGPLQTGSAIAKVIDMWMVSYSAMERYRPLPYAGQVTVLRSEDGMPLEAFHPARMTRMYFDESSLGWAKLCPELRLFNVPGDHFSLILAPKVKEVARIILKTMEGHTSFPIELEQILPSHAVQRAGRAIEIARGKVNFNPAHSAFIEDPYPILHQLRTHAPVHFLKSLSTWWLTRHSDVSAGLRDKRFSVDTRCMTDSKMATVDISPGSVKPFMQNSWWRQQDVPLAKLTNHSLLFLDPPRHQQLRSFLTPAFEPKAMRRWVNYIDERVDALIANIRGQANPDIIRDLALPLPISVITEILCLPHEDVPLLQAWAHDIQQGFEVMRSETAQRVNKSTEDFLNYLRRHIEKVCEAPQKNAFLSLVLESDGTQLSLDDLAANYALIFAAGFETTTSLIGNSVLAFLRNPNQFNLLREHPELVENAAEELLRYEGNVRSVFRIALEDIEIGGKLIQRGDYVTFDLAAANRDPVMFPNPDQLDLTRSNAKQHVAFSQGIHYCLGATLARLEIKSVIAALARHDISLVPGGFEWQTSYTFRALKKLQVVFNS